MKRKILVLSILSVAVFFMLGTDCFAYELPEDYEGKLYQEIPDDAREVYPDGITKDSVSRSSSLSSLLSLALSSFSDSVTDSSPSLTLLFSLAVIVCIAEVFIESQKNAKTIEQFINLALGFSVFSILSPTVTAIKDYISALSAFSRGIAPILSGILLCGGGTSSSVTTACSLDIFAVIADSVCADVLLPITMTCLSFSLIDGFSPDFCVSSVSSYIKKTYMTVIGFIGSLFVASLGMQNVIAANSDTLATKTLKYAIGTSVPIAGGTVVGSLSTLSASISVIKSTVGVGCIIAVVSIMLPVFFRITVARLALSLGSSLSCVCGAKSAERVWRSFHGVFDMLLAIVCIMSVIFVIVLTVFLKTAVAIGE